MSLGHGLVPLQRKSKPKLTCVSLEEKSVNLFFCFFFYRKRCVFMMNKCLQSRRAIMQSANAKGRTGEEAEERAAKEGVDGLSSSLGCEFSGL